MTDETQKLIEEFYAKGGKITRCKSNMPAWTKKKRYKSNEITSR